MTTQTYATQPTQYYLDAIAAEQAGGPMINLAGGTVVVGDSAGQAPSLSALIAANGVTHEVWRGQVISSVAVDANSASQLDVTFEIPAAINGVEIGPFTITEIAILDALGNCCIVATTNVQKTTSGQGQITDLIVSVGVGFGVGSVILQPPSGGYATMAQVIAAYNANLPDCTSPLTKTDTPQVNGWLKRVFGLQPASQPTSTPTVSNEPATLGYGRPATQAEFNAGASTSGRFPWPWPTLQQVSAALAALAASATAQVAAAVASLNTYIAAVAATIPNGATVAQTIAGAVSNVWISPSTLAGALNTATLGSALLSALGAAISVLYPSGGNWFTLPGGWIVQMGTGTLPASGNTTSSQSVTFIAFPNYVLAVNATSMGPANSIGGYVPSMGVEGLSLSGFSATGDTEWGASPTASNVFNQTCPFNWIAIGR